MEVTRDQILYLKPTPSTGPGANELCAAIEYRSEHGVGYFPLLAAVAESVLKCPELAGADSCTLKFVQHEDLKWEAVFTRTDAGQSLKMNVDGQMVKDLLQEAGYRNTLLDTIKIGSAPQEISSSTSDSPPWE